MPFGTVSGVGRGMGVLDEGGDRRREGAVLGVSLGRPIVIKGDFATRLFPNFFGQGLLLLARRSLGLYSERKHLRYGSFAKNVCRSVCRSVRSVLWQNGGADPDAV